MQIEIVQENPEDYKEVHSLIEQAFEHLEISDHKEHFLVERLRKSSAFIPELSLVAKNDQQILGHILLTKLKIKNAFHEFDSLALAPVSVLPEFQGKGIGRLLIEFAHKKAIELGHQSIILLGHEQYYPRFGYVPAHTVGIELPFEVPKENYFAIELIKGSLKDVNGLVEYPKEFFE